MLSKIRIFLTVFLVLASISVMLGGNAVAASKPIDVTFSLDFITLGRHAPWYVALGKGYYEEEGLNVKIVPGKGTAQVIQAIESGIADIGFIDVPSLVISRAAGSTIKMVAVNYQKAPYTVFSLDPGANVTKPKDLEGLELGSGAGSFIPKILQAFMRMHGLDPNTLKIVNIAPSARVAALVSRRVESVDFFIMSYPGISRAVKDSKVRAFLLGDHGLELYSNGIGAKESYLKKNPEVVRAFVRAALRGWKYALSNPEEAADIQRKYAKGLNRQIIIDEIAILKRLAVVPDTQRNGLGWFDPAKMESNRSFMLENVGIKGTPPKAEDLYVTGFLPKKPIFRGDFAYRI
jgi:NitT/TauT family transport system substrate-binding protein